MATPAAGPIDRSSKAISRYRDGYRLAQNVSGLSQPCKVAGVLAGIVFIVFGTLASAAVMRSNPAMIAIASEQAQHNLYLISVILSGAFVALSGWIIGTALEGFGLHLKATLDGAVNSSPFLNDLQRAQLMRLE
jgi:hypothetical protein